MYDIVCVGFSCLDIPVVGKLSGDIFNHDLSKVNEISLTTGGDAVNEAVTCSRLNMKTALVSFTGDDQAGEIIQHILASYNLDLSGMETIKNSSSLIAIPLINIDGERNFLLNYGCAEQFTGLNVDWNNFYKTKILSIGSFYIAEQFDSVGVPVILKGAKDRGVITIADTCGDVKKLGMKHIAESLQHLDFFMPSYEEAADITGKREYEDIADELLDQGVQNVVLKLGGDGCYIKNKYKKLKLPAFKDCEIIDTTGCGDNFVAGFCCGLLHHLNLKDCANFATATAAINASHVGGSGGLTGVNEVLKFLTDRDIHVDFTQVQSY